MLLFGLWPALPMIRKKGALYVIDKLIGAGLVLAGLAFLLL